MPSGNEQLAKLIRFLRLGEAEGVNPSDLPFMPQRQSERKFAADMGVTQATVRRWEKGLGLDRQRLERLANSLGKTSDQLSAYLDGTCSLAEFLQGVTETPRSRKLGQILDWLPLLKPAELFEVIRSSFALLSNYFNLPSQTPSVPTSSMSLSIQAVINSNLEQFDGDRAAQVKAMSAAAMLEVSELEAVLAGVKPSTEQLVALSSVLKQGDTPFDLEALKQLVFQQYGNNHHQEQNHV